MAKETSPRGAGSPPAIRPDLAALPAYVPGARPDGRRLWKLSSNENPAGPLPGVAAAIAAAAGDVNRYPDMASTALTEALAGQLGVAPEAVACGAGSIALLEHALAAFCTPGDEVVYSWRSFEAYPISVQVAGATSVQVPNAPDGSHDLRAMAAAVTDRTRVVIVCTPNNPTSTVVRDDALREFLHELPSHVLLLLDEAYAEYVRDPAAARGLGLLADFPNVLVLRTFSKAYGLAGLRVGYAVGSPGVIAAVRTVTTAFEVNAVAQRAALASLHLQPELLARVADTVTERERVLAAARAAGWRIPAAQGNFFWLPLGDRAAEFVTVANDAGLLVRGFAGHGVRITIGEPQANDAVIALLREERPGRLRGAARPAPAARTPPR